MVETIVKRKLKLFGHICRMGDGRKIEYNDTNHGGVGKKRKTMQRMVTGHRGVVWGEHTGTDTPGTRQAALEDSNQVRSGQLRAFSPWILKKNLLQSLFTR